MSQCLKRTPALPVVVSTPAAFLVLFGHTVEEPAGGDIVHVQEGVLTSLGDFSIGGLIQSIGGGGGVAAISYGETAPPSAVRLGASGGSGNDGGRIDQTLSGGAVATGDFSPALILQSVGAGGGVVTLAGDGHPQVVLGGSAGAQGAGGEISLANSGSIASLGVGGYAVVLQSIGGGGAAVFGDFTNADVSLNSDNAGDGGAIAFTQTGDIGALGDGSVGILAQSLGGGGGLVNGVFAGTAGGQGAGGSVTLDIDGAIVAYGTDSSAVLAQSLGSSGTGDIRLLSSGDIRGGSGAGVAVGFDGGADNLIDIGGTLSAVSGLAIETTSGDDTVENRGVIVGNAFLGTGANLIRNHSGATYFTIDTLDLRDSSGSGAFVNDGTLELGLRAPRFPIDLFAGDAFDLPDYGDVRTATLYGTPVISQVTLDGDFAQGAGGTTHFDLAFGPYASDRIDASGDVAIAGTAGITLTWLENADLVPLATSGGVAVDNGLVVADTIALDYRVVAAADAIFLGYDSTFAQPFLTTNETAIGNHIDSALEVGNAAGVGRLLALLGNLSQGQEGLYADIFGDLDPEIYLAPLIDQLDASRHLGASLFGCDTDRGGERKVCGWGAAGYHSLSREAGPEQPKIQHANGMRLHLGLGVPVGRNVTVAAAVAYDDAGTAYFGRGQGRYEAEHYAGGIGAKLSFGKDLRAEASVAGTIGRLEARVSRHQSFFGDAIGTADVRSTAWGLIGAAGYRLGNGPFYAKPAVIGSITRLNLADFAETGLAGNGMIANDFGQTVASISPRLELGANFDAGKFSVTAGGIFRDKSELVGDFRLIGTDPASERARISTAIDSKAFVVGAELTVHARGRTSVSLRYDGEIGSSVRSHTIDFDLSFAF